jgi:hypothetical protein
VNNRVAGNALVGLYDLQDEKVIPHIVNMAKHGKPCFAVPQLGRWVEQGIRSSFPRWKT